MPRITTQQYLARRVFLKRAWNEFPAIFVLLRPNQQRALHAYFRPTEDWTDEQARAHRLDISKAQPSLPARAGKYFTELIDFAEAAAKRAKQTAAEDPPRARVPASQRKLRVRALMRPEPDAKKLAYALIQHVRKQQEDEREVGKAA
jgi:hypothetical protein